jgi:multidrug efflux system membrane fusion protein
MPVGKGASYSASITPNEQIDLTFKSGGYVGSIKQVRGADGRMRSLDLGDYVKAGEVLASVRSSEYQDRIQQVVADLAKAEAAHEQAKLSFERTSTLFAQQSATKPEYDQAKAQFDEAAASVDGAKAELATARTQLADSILRAPRDGWIAKRSIDVGSLVGASTSAFSLIDTHLVRVSFGVPDTAMQLVHLGQKFRINTEAAGDFEGRVTEIAPSADANSRVYSVEVTVANPQGRLKAGMIATLALEKSPSQEVTAIPLEALLRSPRGSNAFLVMIPQQVSDGYIARQRAVQVGEAYGNNIAITSGLEPGDRVITAGAGLVHDGDRLQLIP